MNFDNYLDCKAYQNQAAHQTHKNFTSFFNENDASFYFARVDNTGNVLMPSEGYPKEATREKGILSVVKNSGDAQKYSVKQIAKNYFVSLKAGNNKEIALSCPFKTEAEATAAIATMVSPILNTAEVKTVASKVNKTAKTVDAVAVAPKTTVTKKAVEKVAAISKTKSTKTKIAKSEETAEFTQDSKIEYHISTVYPEISSYLGHQTLNDNFGKTGYATFEMGKSNYFVVYDFDNTVFLRSNGYETAAQRNAGLEMVKQNITIASSYKIIEIDNNYYVVLNDSNGNELARSAAHTQFSNAFLKTPAGWNRPVEMAGTLY